MITVLSGTLWFGIGKTFLESTPARCPTDILFIEPHGDAHYSLTKDEPAMLQIFAIGPSGMNYVNPPHDPRRK